MRSGFTLNLYVLPSGVQRVTPAGVVSAIVVTAGVNTIVITVQASGNSYVLVVYAHTGASKRFAGAETVRVIVR